MEKLPLAGKPCFQLLLIRAFLLLGHGLSEQKALGEVLHKGQMLLHLPLCLYVVNVEKTPCKQLVEI